MRILVVDDEAVFADGVRRGLEAEGFSVDVAHDGVDGLWRARETVYDAIVLDLMMPGLSGSALCRTLRDEGDWTPVLMLTAKDGDRDQIDGLDAGADDYVVKPLEYSVLVARLRALVRRGRPERPVVHRVGDLLIDPALREVHRGDVPIRLTSREFAVVDFLARHRDRVVAKREILEGVWDDAFDGDLNIVEVYVARLRAKLDRPFGTESITTLRGAGYRLVEG
ncbi:DNA-binding response OmpR family regulator [Rathayibacter sp. PhB93]|uniref:response regulator transcription factor n=1 Tax=unclassified Rathayibacter TaxID=2609250 RepID=UPI000F496F26|nr:MULTISPECIES: response regulator transcription factor [unclassified Rathayibacter]ROQ16107.1 DNA-binding response OmpR family regulator [Rathayibacter sp. PhB93]TDQ16048.1 DNA-binding response OmpR family regulator [Rathayibacter sp. PhB1]